ncbi:MAG TPA: RNA 3'-phosphate cyclase [Actinobacteria bacterium]|nr:RNA 3'-phosphate cyclase [Actinomycetota bacterium]
MLEIDGSLYSGSGTIVRQSVAYAALTGRPVRIRNARAGRRRPGLRAQHLRAAEAIRDLVGGSLRGAQAGSRTLEFWPGDRQPAGRYAWDIGTAGSATMLALAILPVLALRGLGSEAEIRGGLFQDFAPSVFHLTHVLLPMLAQMGMAAEVDLVRPGYVPAGGGIIRVAVPPMAGPLHPLAPRRGETPARVWGISLASHLGERGVPARMAAAARSVLAAAGISAAIQERSDSTAAQAGAAFALFADFIGGTRLGADRAGAPHRPAESIGAQVAHRLLGEISSGATIDRHASDQIIPYAALAEGTSKFTVPFITGHAQTAGWLAALFLGAGIHAEQHTLTVRGHGTSTLRTGSRQEHDPPVRMPGWDHQQPECENKQDRPAPAAGTARDRGL